MKKFILPRLLLLSVFLVWMHANCYAVHKTAVMSGAWSNASIWAPLGLPLSNDSIIIAANVYYDIPVTITAGGALTINPGCFLCGQDSFKILCGGYFTVMSYALMSGVYIRVADGVVFSAGNVFAQNAFVTNPCSTGFINNGTVTIGLPFACPPTTGVEQINTNNDEVKIFPNPFTDYLEVSCKRNDIMEILMYDFISRKCMKNTFTHSLSLNTKQLERGIYLYEVRNKNRIIKTGKIIKE